MQYPETLPDLRLAPMPHFVVRSGLTASASEAAHIRRCIQDLARIDKPGLCYSLGPAPLSFPPVPGQISTVTFFLTSEQCKENETLRQLVAFGGIAIPFLLESLTDLTPTGIGFKSGQTPICEAPSDLDRWNPFHKVEATTGRTFPPTAPFAVFPPIDRYQVCVGDLCYVALGKIVGRNYYCAQGAPIQAFIDSPAHKPRLCAALRAVWSSKSPRQMLLDSLLIDY